MYYQRGRDGKRKEKLEVKNSNSLITLTLIVSITYIYIYIHLLEYKNVNGNFSDLISSYHKKQLKA